MSQADYADSQERGGNGMAIACLILGILSLFCSILTAIPAFILGIIVIINSQKRGGSGANTGLAIAGIVVAMGGVFLQLIMMALLLPAIQAARGAAMRNASTNNMKQIELGMINYHDATKKFPLATGAAEEGKPLLSWRVHLLPYINEEGLYKQFHLNEPWDSPHNQKLIPLMPAVYAAAGSTVAAEGKTVYLTPRGPDTVYPADKQIGLREIDDGISNTINLVEVNDQNAVIWTKPDDYDVDRADLIDGLVGLRPRGFIAGFADGSVRFIAEDVDPQTLRAVFTRAGGETVDLSNF